MTSTRHPDTVDDKGRAYEVPTFLGRLSNRLNLSIFYGGAEIRFPCTSASKFNTLRLGLFSVEAFSFGGMP